ncbi:MAG TPA: glutamate--tRNA ligase, partial [bacterium]|nr:glutamate--tRNA ligase [bacterium]
EDSSSANEYFQSFRWEKGIYQKYADQLIKSGKAYYCYCTPEELKEKREKAMKEGRSPGYDGYCRNISRKETEEKKARGVKPALRFRVDEKKKIKFLDLVKGEVEFDTVELVDFVILKASGFPVYNFACTVDDFEMKITHVIRGDDHISNTPRQILLYEALGLPMPQFAHLPMIMGRDGQRLSKRHGATSLKEFEEQGYLPEALINYLSLLGWGTEDSQQVFSVKDLIDKFDLSRCSKSKAIFDYDKLGWLNGVHIRNLGTREIIKRAEKYLKEAGLETGDPMLEKALDLEKEKIKLLKDVPDLVSFFFNDSITPDDDAKKKIEKYNKNQELPDIFNKLLEEFKAIEFTTPVLEETIRKFCEKNALNTGQVFHPLRAAVSGRTKGPSLFEMLELIGKEKVLRRVEEALKWLKK